MGCLAGLGFVVGTVLFFVDMPGPVLGVVLWVASIWMFMRWGNNRRERQAAEIARQTTPEHLAGRLLPLSTRGRQKVVGEQYYPHALASVIAGRPVGRVGDWERALRISVCLVPEPANPHDPNAIAVKATVGAGGVCIGYLPREDAVKYQPPLRALGEVGFVGLCDAGIVEGPGGYSVFLHLAPPDECVLQNEPRAATRLLPERSCALTGEGQHQDVLARYRLLQPLWATVHPGTVERGKYAGEPTIEVCFDGDLAGVLSAGQGARYRHLLAATREGVGCVEAQVYEGSHGREARVFLPKVD